MDILLLPGTANIEILKKGLPKHKISKSKSYEIRFTIKDGKLRIVNKEKDCSLYDFVWLNSYWRSRGLAYAISLYLQKNNVRHTKVEKCTSKIVDQAYFALNTLPCPNTFFVNSRNIEQYIEEIEDICGYPLIIKNIKGSRGNHMILAKNRKQFLDAVRKLPPRMDVMYQKYIPNDYDWGVLIADGKVVSVEQSYHHDGEYRNNECNGAKEVFRKIEDCPEHVRELALNAAKVLNLSWCRPDILIDKTNNKEYLLEVNRAPGITVGTTEETAIVDYLGSLVTKHMS